jgi:predicted hydrocarbon binding protein
MDRKLMEEMLWKMKQRLLEGGDIGNLKVGALYALGEQLSAIFYYVGHELGSKIEIDNGPITKIEEIIEKFIEVTKKYHLGKIIIDEQDKGHITFHLEENQCNSCKDLPTTVPLDSSFCSFEAGVFAGIVERMCNKPIYAQELECRLQGKASYCQFMIVIPTD